MGIFSKIARLWTSREMKKMFIISCLVGSAGIINLTSKTACLHVGENIWFNLLLRFFLILVITPTSVLLEWIVFITIKLYVDGFINFIMSTLITVKWKELTLRHLSQLYLEKDDLAHVEQLTKHLTHPIKQALEESGQHSLEVVPTGSVFERYGKPLAAAALETNLKTDYDVMFAFKKEDLPIEFIMKNDEFLHIFVFSKSCFLLNKMNKEHSSAQAIKLSAEKARQFLKNVVENTQLSNIVDNPRKIRNKLRNLFAFLFNLPRVGR